MCAELSDDFPAYPYRNVARELIGRIANGDLGPGARVPSERELASQYGISRMTARAALNLLGQRGLIERRDRSGTFVSLPKVRLDLSAVAGFSARLLRQGITPGAEVIEARTSRADEMDDAVAQALGVGGQENVHVLIRRRTGNGVPLALEASYFPASLCPELLEHDLTGSMYELLHEKYGLAPVRLHQEVEVTQLDSSHAAKLGVRRDLMVLQVLRTAWHADGRPFEFARDIYRGDRLVFVANTDQTNEQRKDE